MSCIKVKNLTKEYGHNKGVFDLNFIVEEGEIVGFLGPNGAGKTTTIRNLMGFIKPDKGNVRIFNKPCFTSAAEIQKNLGYLPGEIAFMDEMNGLEFIHFIADLKGIRDFSRAEELMEFFELDAKGKIKKMSKGMKQKIGIVCAFMQNPSLLILDEPTSGLDPLMQARFVELMQQEKKKGTTILMSSHMFEEIENTCDRVLIIKEGRLIASEEMETLQKSKRKIYQITFQNIKNANEFTINNPQAIQKENQVRIEIAGNPDTLIKQLAQYSIRDLDMQRQTLEELFLHYYGGTKHD